MREILPCCKYRDNINCDIHIDVDKYNNEITFKTKWVFCWKWDIDDADIIKILE